MIIYPHCPVHRGRCHAALRWWNRTRRPRAGDDVTPTPVRGRTPQRSQACADCVNLSARTLGCPARSSLTAWAQRDHPGGVLAESADRTSSDAAMERREAPAFLKRECGYCKTGAPLGAASPRFSEGQGKEDSVPDAAKNTGTFACPLDLHPIGSEFA